MMRPPQMNPQQVMQLVMRLCGLYEGKRVSYDWWRCQQPFCLRAPPMNQVSAPVAGQNMFIHCFLWKSFEPKSKWRWWFLVVFNSLNQRIHQIFLMKRCAFVEVNERHSGMSQSTEMQKQMLGEKLYPMVAKYQPELVARCESSQCLRRLVKQIGIHSCRYAAAGRSFDRNWMELNVFKTLKMSPVIEMIRMSTENHKSHKSLGVFFCLETSPRIHRHHIGVDTFQRGWQDHRYDVGNGQQWADAFIGVQSSECVVMDDQRFVDRWWLATFLFSTFHSACNTHWGHSRSLVKYVSICSDIFWIILICFDMS